MRSRWHRRSVRSRQANVPVGLFFFFQAEDGIRDYKVTGVQTCALPISDGIGEFIGCAAVTGASTGPNVRPCPPSQGLSLDQTRPPSAGWRRGWDTAVAPVDRESVV